MLLSVVRAFFRKWACFLKQSIMYRAGLWSCRGCFFLVWWRWGHEKVHQTPTISLCGDSTTVFSHGIASQEPVRWIYFKRFELLEKNNTLKVLLPTNPRKHDLWGAIKLLLSPGYYYYIIISLISGGSQSMFLIK